MTDARAQTPPPPPPTVEDAVRVLRRLLPSDEVARRRAFSEALNALIEEDV